MSRASMVWEVVVWSVCMGLAVLVVACVAVWLEERGKP